MKNYSVLIKCGTTSPEQLASVLTRMKFYPDDYRYTLAKLLQGCDAIIDQSAEPTQDAESPAGNAEADPLYVSYPDVIEFYPTAAYPRGTPKPQPKPLTPRRKFSFE